MDARYSQALRGIRYDGQMGDFLKEATSVLNEEELRAIIGAASYELDKYKRINARNYMKGIIEYDGKRLCDLTDDELNHALIRKYSFSKTMIRALKKERKRRKKQ